MQLLIDGPAALFGGLIDYAGIFPPASLSLDDAAAEYRTARSGDHAWMLGRFLCTTSRLEDLAGLLTGSMTRGEQPWSLSAVVDEPPGVGALHAQVFDRHMSPAARVDAVEIRLPESVSDGRSVEAAVEEAKPVVEAMITISPEVVPYFEVARTEAWATGVHAAIEALASLRNGMLRRLGAKLRTGGTTPDAFPSSADVARFIVACHTTGLPYKATAGLHHPVRHHDAELDVMRHGFLNMLGAAGIARSGGTVDEVASVLDETDPEAFVIGASGLSVAGTRIPIPGVRAMRTSLFPAYGSCSFDEPVADLTAMGVIG